MSIFQENRSLPAGAQHRGKAQKRQARESGISEMVFPQIFDLSWEKPPLLPSFLKETKAWKKNDAEKKSMDG